jgi:hypothetical protein
MAQHAELGHFDLWWERGAGDVSDGGDGVETDGDKSSRGLERGGWGPWVGVPSQRQEVADHRTRSKCGYTAERKSSMKGRFASSAGESSCREKSSKVWS